MSRQHVGRTRRYPGLHRLTHQLIELARAILRAVIVVSERLGGYRQPVRPAALAVPDEDEQTEEGLDAIPSETSREERRLLRALFSRYWAGSGTVVEIGPFFGGTTRAIGLGMLAHPRFDPASRLLTLDRFGSYHDAESLASLLQPVAHRGLLQADEIERLTADGDFLKVFRRLHAGTSYEHLVQPLDQPLPDAPSDPPVPELEELTDVSALFVDGCKSWYSTVYLLRTMAGKLRSDARLAFQDYGWYSCFWIPACVGLLPDALALDCWADSTYVFMLRESLDPDTVAERLPDEPTGLGPERLDGHLAGLAAAAARRGDRRAELVHQLQRGSALAYLGEIDAARAHLERVRRRWRFSEYRAMARAARRAPTYRPGGEPILL